MTLDGFVYTVNVVCSVLLQRANHSFLVLLTPCTQTWGYSQALSWNELVHPVSEEEQAQLTLTAHSRRTNNAKFIFFNLWKSSNTNSTGF